MPFKERDKRLAYLKRYREENKKLAELARQHLNSLSDSFKGIDESVSKIADKYSDKS